MTTSLILSADERAIIEAFMDGMVGKGGRLFSALSINGMSQRLRFEETCIAVCVDDQVFITPTPYLSVRAQIAQGYLVSRMLERVPPLDSAIWEGQTDAG